MKNINTEAIFYSSNYTTKSGWKVTFQLPDQEAARMLDDIGAGKRYVMALVPLTEDDQPDNAAVVHAEKPKKHWNDMSLAQQAGILCNDERFWRFVSYKTTSNTDGVDENKKLSAYYIRSYCMVASRSDLDKLALAAKKFEELKADFDVFTGKIAAPR